MMPPQAQNYAARIDRVLAHLEARNDDAVPKLAELASVAALSACHFHRVFRLMTGETIAEAVRRIALARSLASLETARSVTAAAGRSGYATSQGFARALRATGGVSASELRADPERLAQLLDRLKLPELGSSRPPLTIEVVDVNPFRVLALRNVGDYAALNQAFGLLFETLMEQIPPEGVQGIYGVPLDDEKSVESEARRFDCAFAVGNSGRAVGDIKELQLGGGRFARVRHDGNYDAIQGTLDRLYAATLAKGLDLEDAPPFIHYLDDPEEIAAEDCRADLHLPLADAIQ